MPGATPEEREEWRRGRAEAAAAHAAAAERARLAETSEAHRLLAGFVAEVRRRRIDPVPLRARVAGGRARTGLHGWYLRRDESLAVTEDGVFHVLTVDGGLRERLLGVRPAPADPPLQVGRGARDGESVELAELLRRRLAELGGDPGSGPPG
ncbi:hypothetical protein MO973_45500 [Paenibacillus sp. TRM 82003]|uniref:hypothetical protein n=1 Tax=Kineococcus sp. TRM81007 TaxID=2925831 RepID=UPI001F585487|nr:hypothetical protein [Kineococcus sp. TRM81007]MCI2240373.1 hypothetical protein [Kineococcus sp. TRM81007]MCI3927451.1 hypothetical protein [Paenibacillus sp. TRM 82003]